MIPNTHSTAKGLGACEKRRFSISGTSANGSVNKVNKSTRQPREEEYMTQAAFKQCL